jgi:hypothetical protein
VLQTGAGLGILQGTLRSSPTAAVLQGRRLGLVAGLASYPLSLSKATTDKLSPHFYRPYQVIEVINEVVGHLRLPTGARIQGVFHVGLQKLFRGQPPEYTTRACITVRCSYSNSSSGSQGSVGQRCASAARSSFSGKTNHHHLLLRKTSTHSSSATLGSSSRTSCSLRGDRCDVGLDVCTMPTRQVTK